MAVLKVYDGAAWVDAEAKVYDGSVWKPKQKFYDGTAWVDLFASGTTPSVSDILLSNTVASGPVNCGIYFNEATVGAVNNIVMRHNAVYAVMGTDDNSVDHTGEWTGDSVTGTDWEVACTSITSGAWSVHLGSPAAATGVYVDLSVAREWKVRRSGGKGYTPGTTQCIAVFRLREKADTSNFTEFNVDCKGVQT